MFHSNNLYVIPWPLTHNLVGKLVYYNFNLFEGIPFSENMKRNGAVCGGENSVLLCFV